MLFERRVVFRYTFAMSCAFFIVPCQIPAMCLRQSDSFHLCCFPFLIFAVQQDIRTTQLTSFLGSRYTPQLRTQCYFCLRELAPLRLVLNVAQETAEIGNSKLIMRRHFR
jgi:hypothetical protein